jgi:hypothetical protein
MYVQIFGTTYVLMPKSEMSIDKMFEIQIANTILYAFTWATLGR